MPMRRLLVMFSIGWLVTGCATTRGGETNTSDSKAGVRSAVARLATPRNPAVVAKGRVDMLDRLVRDIYATSDGGEPSESSGSADDGADQASNNGLLGAKAALARMVAGTSVTSEWSSYPETLKQVGPIDADRMVWFGIGWRAQDEFHRLLEYGGLVADLRQRRLDIRRRLLVPSSEPNQMASSVREFCRAGESDGRIEDRCPMVEGIDVVASDEYVAFRLRWNSTVEWSGTDSTAASSGHERFGFEGATSAWRAFLNHDGAGVYTTYDGIRRLTTMVELADAQQALARIHGEKAEKLSGQAVAAAQRYLSLAAGDASQYVDAALLHRTDTGDGNADLLDIISTPIRSSDDAQDNREGADTAGAGDDAGKSVSAPMADVAGSFLEASWFVLPGGSRGNQVSHPMLDMEENARELATVMRRAGSLGTMSMLASLMEAPRAFLRSFAPDAVPARGRETAVTLNLGLAEGDPQLPDAKVYGGVAVAWPTGVGPEVPVDKLPDRRAGVEFAYEWTQGDKRDVLKIAINRAVSDIFGGRESPDRRRRYISFRKDRVLEVLGNDNTYYRYRPLVDGLQRWMPGDAQHLSYGEWPNQQVLRLTLGGESPRAPGRYAIDGAYLPPPMNFAHLRCRARHSRTTFKAFEAISGATPEDQWKLLARGREVSKQALTSCSRRLADRHQAGTRHALASWWDWSAAWMWAGYRFAWASYFRGKACEVHQSKACVWSSREQSASGWVHPPVSGTRLGGDSSDGPDRPWVVQLHRHGKLQVHRTDEAAGGNDRQVFESVAAMATPWLIESSKAGAEQSGETTETGGESDTDEQSNDSEARPDVRLVPDALTPAHLVGRAVDRVRQTDAQPFISTVRRLKVPTRYPPLPGTTPLPVTYALPELRPTFRGVEEAPRSSDALQLGAVVSIRPDGVRIYELSPESESSEGRTNAGVATDDREPDVSLSLRWDISDVLESVGQGNSRNGSDTVQTDAKRLRRVIRAYPLNKINQQMMTVGGSPEDDESVRFRVHPDVPIQAVVSVMSAALVKRKEAPFETREAFDAAEIATTRRGHSMVPEYLFAGWTIQFGQSTNAPSDQTSPDD